MQPTQAADPCTVWQAVVAVRVPPTDAHDLATSASRRLESEEDVRAAEVQTLCGVDPAMSATLVTIEVRVEVTVALDGGSVSERLIDAPGTQRVDDLQRAT